MSESVGPFKTPDEDAAYADWPDGAFEAPQSQCPDCGAWQEDLDGFGVLYCDYCKWCSHASIDGDRCSLCGCTQSDLNRP